MFWGSHDDSPNFDKRRDHAKIKKLDSMEDAWWESEMQVKKDRVKLVAQRQHKSNTFTNSLLDKCKLHGGPVSTEQEVQQISKEKSFLRCELQYRRLTHSKDALLGSQLYKVNGLSSEEMATNLLNLVNSGTVSTFNNCICLNICICSTSMIQIHVLFIIINSGMKIHQQLRFLMKGRSCR